MEKNVKKNEGFNQVCVWPGTLVGKDNIEKFEKFMLDNFNSRIQYLEEIKTLPDKGVEGTGGRNDVFFAVHEEDIGKFAVPRLSYGIRWIEDVLDPINYLHHIYPKRVYNYKTW